jgi:preprotein translocase SecF subunit
LVAFGLYIFVSLFYKEFQIDTFTITALLTILGYSINDTIIVFDRVRTNLKKSIGKNKKKLAEIIDDSVNQTILRSIYTSLTLFLVLVAIFFFGPTAIKGFILVMIFGTIVGTYSSIFIAAPMLYDINKNKDLKPIEEKVYNPDDKIVV